MHYRGQVVLVTGGSGNIGQAVVRRLVAAGLRVGFTFHSNQTVAEQLTQEFSLERVKAIAVSKNNLDEARAVIAEMKKLWGSVDYLVNSVGSIRDRSFARMEEGDWRDIMTVNLDLPFAFTRALVFDLLKQKQGAIVNIISIAALTGSAGQTNYAAAKAGVLGMTRSLAREMGHFGIRVNAVAPGYIESKMTSQLPERVRRQALNLIPMARFGQPEDVATAVSFLLADEARYINGQVLVVDGGLAM